MSVFNDDPFDDDEVPQDEPNPTLAATDLNSPLAPVLTHATEDIVAESPVPTAVRQSLQDERIREEYFATDDAVAQPALFSGIEGETDEARHGAILESESGTIPAGAEGADDISQQVDGSLSIGKKRSRESSNAGDMEDVQPASQLLRTEAPGDETSITAVDDEDPSRLADGEDLRNVETTTMKAYVDEYQNIARAETIAALHAEILKQNLRIAALTEELRNAQTQRASLDDALRAPVIRLPDEASSTVSAPPPEQQHLTDRAALQSAQGTAMLSLLELETAQRAKWFADASASIALTACEWSRRVASLYGKTLQEIFQGGLSRVAQKASAAHGALAHDTSGDATKIALSALPSEIAQIRKAIGWMTKWAERHSHACLAVRADVVVESSTVEQGEISTGGGVVDGVAAQQARMEPSEEWQRLQGLLGAVGDRLLLVEQACESQSTLVETWRRAVDSTMGAIVEPRAALVLEVLERLAVQRPPTAQETAAELELREVRQRLRVLEAVVAAHVLGEEGTSFNPQSALPAVFKEQAQKIGQLEAAVEEYKRQLSAAHRMLTAGLVGAPNGTLCLNTQAAPGTSTGDGCVGQDLRLFAAYRWHKYATNCTHVIGQLVKDRAEARATVATLRRSLAVVADYSALLHRVASQLRNDVAASEADNVVLREALQAAVSVLPHVTHSTGEALDAEGVHAMVSALESLNDHVQRIAAPREGVTGDTREAWMAEREAAIREDIRNACSTERTAVGGDGASLRDSPVVSFLCTALRAADDALAEACGLDPVASERLTEGLSNVAEWIADDATATSHSCPVTPIVLSTLPRVSDALSLSALPATAADAVGVQMLRKSFEAEIGRHQARWEWLVKQTHGSIVARVAELEKEVSGLRTELAAKTSAAEHGETVARELLLTQTKLRDLNVKLVASEDARVASERAQQQHHAEVAALQQQIRDASQERHRLEAECLRLQQTVEELQQQQQQSDQNPEQPIEDEPCDEDTLADAADETLVAEDQTAPADESSAVDNDDDPLRFAEDEAE